MQYVNTSWKYPNLGITSTLYVAKHLHLQVTVIKLWAILMSKM